ncbi:ABC transporter permease [Leptolyngbya sp. 15MV]|nr:ABC transporter permease [Leptolyngbya sp. 15MV]
MNWVAIRMLVGDRLKYLALIVGIAFAALMVTQQAAIFTGYARQIGAWLRDTAQADLWVVDGQVRHSEDLKRLSDTTLQRVRGLDGVAWAVPMYKGWLPVRLDDGTLLNVRFVGIDDASMIGTPPGMPHETAMLLRQDRALLIDESEASTRLRRLRTPGEPGLRVGDRLSVNDNDAMVAGTYRRSPDFFWEPVAYTLYSRAITWAPRERRQLTYVLVKLQEGADPAAVARQITAATGHRALTGPQFIRQSTLWILRETGILINFGITILLGFLIGVLVCGLLLYLFIVENTRYFAALKAMGATNRRVIGMVALQIAVAGLLGYGIGLGGTAVVGTLIQGGVIGGLAYALVWQIPVLGAVAVITCCMVAGLISISRVLGLEPATVFKA